MVIGGFAVLCVFVQLCVITLVSNAEQNPPNFIFGDSLVDVGNNNYLVSLAKADKRSNGIDFVPAHRQPTGRFTNGKTVLDLTGDELGSNCYSLPYLAYNSNEFAATCELCVITLVSNAEQNPPNFIFGDSLVDVGNNNYLVSLAKADKQPNGIDFVPAHRHPTGRFTNGKTVMDLTGDELGSNCYPLPYLAYNSNEFAATCGVNYASGGAGILNKTGAVFIGRINMDEQLDYFANTRQHIISVLGMDMAMELIRSSMFSIVIGSNDFLADYLIPIVEKGTRVLIPPRMFVKLVIARFRPQLERMHRLGARKIAVANVGPLGCVPYQRETNPLAGQDCVADTNELVMYFNSELRHLIIDLNSKLNPEAIFVYLDSYHIVSSLLQNAINYGFEVIDSGCCRVNGPIVNRIIPCGMIKSIYCPDRDIYFFWDPFHPTEAANKLIAKQMLDGGPEDAFPMNLRKLRQL